jgi:hypothetical protein
VNLNQTQQSVAEMMGQSPRRMLMPMVAAVAVASLVAPE